MPEAKIIISGSEMKSVMIMSTLRLFLPPFSYNTIRSVNNTNFLLLSNLKHKLFSSWMVLSHPFRYTKYAYQSKKSLVIQDVPVSVYVWVWTDLLMNKEGEGNKRSWEEREVCLLLICFLSHYKEQISSKE